MSQQSSGASRSDRSSSGSSRDSSSGSSRDSSYTPAALSQQEAHMARRLCSEYRLGQLQLLFLALGNARCMLAACHPPLHTAV